MPSRIVAIDVETTGLSPTRGHRVIEIGAVAIEGGSIIEGGVLSRNFIALFFPAGAFLLLHEMFMESAMKCSLGSLHQKLCSRIFINSSVAA